MVAERENQVRGAWTQAALLGTDTTPIPAPSVGLRRDLVLLDRDGTLNRLRPGYVTDPAELGVLPGAVVAVRQLNELGARVIVVTNQRGLARGELQAGQLQSVHLQLLAEMEAGGATLDGFQVCGHEAGTCECRKPAPGLIYQAIQRCDWVQPGRVLMVGDSASDEGAAHQAGIDFVRIEDPQIGLTEKIEKVMALCAHDD